MAAKAAGGLRRRAARAPSSARCCASAPLDAAPELTGVGVEVPSSQPAFARLLPVTHGDVEFVGFIERLRRGAQQRGQVLAHEPATPHFRQGAAAEAGRAGQQAWMQALQPARSQLGGFAAPTVEAGLQRGGLGQRVGSGRQWLVSGRRAANRAAPDWPRARCWQGSASSGHQGGSWIMIFSCRAPRFVSCRPTGPIRAWPLRPVQCPPCGPSAGVLRWPSP